MDFRLRVWRQHDAASPGKFVEYKAGNISHDASFLEMLDAVNLDLARKGEDTIAFDHDCREGICGSCGVYINGRAHGPMRGVAKCQIYMRTFNDGATIVVGQWRGKEFPVPQGLV